MRARLLSTAMLAASLAVAGCGGDKSTGPKGTLPGTYTLRSVNGSNVPVTVLLIGSYKLEVTGGSAVLRDDNTFTGSVSYKETDTGTVTETTSSCSGTYTRSGSTVTFVEAVSQNEDCGDTYSGTFSGSNTLTIDFDPSVRGVFTK